MEIVTQEGDITLVKADAIVNAEAHAPVPVGEAVYAAAEKLSFKGIIHAPMMEKPGQKVTEENVRKAVQASVICADSYGVKTLAMPGIGSGAGGLSPISCADVMIETLRHYESNTVRKVILIDGHPEMMQAFRDAIFAERS